MEDYASSTFLGGWTLVAPYLRSRFHIFNRPILDDYLSWVEKAPTYFSLAYVQHEMTFLLQLRICTFLLKVWQLLAPQVHMHFLQTSTMTHPLSLSLRMTPFPQHLKPTFILVRARGQGYSQLLSHLSIRFASHTLFSPQRLRFRLGVIQPLASNLLMCECEHMLDTSSTHLIHCMFGGQWIATRDAI